MTGIKRRTRFHIVMQAFFTFKNNVTTAEIYDWLIVNKIPVLYSMTKGTLVGYLKEDPNIINNDTTGKEAKWAWKS